MGEAFLMQKGEVPEPWGGYYYKDGEEYPDITGGWVSIESTLTWGRSYSEATKEINNFYQEVRVDSSGANMHSHFITENKVSLLGISNLKIDWQGIGTTNGTAGVLRLINSYSLQLSQSNPISPDTEAFFNVLGSFEEISIFDVSSLNSTYYIAVQCRGENGVNSDMILRTFKIWGE